MEHETCNYTKKNGQIEHEICSNIQLFKYKCANVRTVHANVNRNVLAGLCLPNYKVTHTVSHLRRPYMK